VIPDFAWIEQTQKMLFERKQSVYRRGELLELILNERSTLGIPANLRESKILSALHQRTLLKEVDLHPLTEPKNRAGTYKTVSRFTWGSPSAHEIALSFRSGSYISHGTAASLHGLLKEDGSIYVNKEQSTKTAKTSTLSQVGINRAFANRSRESNYRYGYGKHSIVLLNGKNTNKLAVENLHTAEHADIASTTLERTLVDIVVRPAYAGGPQNVLDAFRRARGRLDIAQLFVIWKQLGYTYPYHQALGFYLNRAAYPSTDVDVFRSLPNEYDFYLANQIANKQYDSAWRIHYPRELV